MEDTGKFTKRLFMHEIDVTPVEVWQFSTQLTLATSEFAVVSRLANMEKPLVPTINWRRRLMPNTL